MKTITFFSEKGGVGKSSFTMMYASWLKYVHGVNVAVADYNLRIGSYRVGEKQFREKTMRRSPELGLKQFDEENAWPIASYTVTDRQRLKDKTQFPCSYWLRQQINDGPLQDAEVIIFDLPGSMSGGEFVDLLSNEFINLIVVPFARETQTIQSTYKLLKYLEGNNYCMFLNMAKLNFANIRVKYESMLRMLIDESKWRILPDMVAYSDKMGDMDRVDDIRSTFYYPDFSQEKFGKSRDLGIENLFIDVTRELAKTGDFADTVPADLSFVDAMQKVNDGRQFFGSSFPDYETF